MGMCMLKKERKIYIYIYIEVMHDYICVALVSRYFLDHVSNALSVSVNHQAWAFGVFCDDAGMCGLPVEIQCM